nr:glutathione-S-transferase omega 3 [Plodia interpunctella]
MSYYQHKSSEAPPPPPLPPGQLRLYHVHMNPYAHRVRLVLEAKRVPYELHALDPLRLPDWFREKNPRLKIPVLEVPTPQGDRCLFESIVICDYLDERYPQNPLHSSDPLVKAQDRLLIERFNELIKGSLECFDTNFTFGGDQILQTVDVFEKELAARGTPYFGGSSAGMLDYMVWPWLERLCLLRCLRPRAFDAKRDAFPHMSQWGHAMQCEAVVKQLASSPERYLQYYRSARAHAMGYCL